MYIDSRLENQRLEAKLLKLKIQQTKNFDQLTDSCVEEIREYYTFTTGMTPLMKSIDNDYAKNSYFATLTFDPRKFGYDNDEDDEQNYLLQLIKNVSENTHFHNIYGCFEKHQDGRTHTHFIFNMYAYGIDYVTLQLKRELTDFISNSRAADVQPIRDMQKVIDYINKEPHPKTWFMKGNDWKIET